ncbi:exonuclease SbcCD subunit D [Micrococcales bacterium 31B]|nr:exonuclease SbcCD subunit D [Micrococcales bacterium 31B]
MKLLHTSDWHLGRTLHGHDLHSFHAAFFEFLTELVVREGVDAVLVAGDIYDRAVPGAESVRLLDSALHKLCAVTTVVLTSGNHDSPQRLGFAAGLLHERLRICTRVEGLAAPVILHDPNGGEVCVYALPYLEPDIVRPAFAADGFEEPELERSHEAVLAAAMRRVRADLAGRPGARSVVLAHAFVVGGKANETSDSERDIRVGGVDAVPSGVFAGVDYVALGHLHGAQDVDGGDTRLRYSGSPLAFSFSERHHTKSVTLLDLPPQGELTVRAVPCPGLRPLSEVTGHLDELLGAAYDDQAEHWVKATVTDAKRPPDAVQRLRARFPYLVHTQFAPEGYDAAARSAGIVTSEADPRAVTADFVHYVTGQYADASERDLIGSVHDEARVQAGLDS